MLIVRKMTWSTTNQPTFAAAQLGTYGLTSTGTTSTRLVYDLTVPNPNWNQQISGSGGSSNGLVFTISNNVITLHCNDVAAGDSDHPFLAENITTSGTSAQSITVSEGDTVNLRISAGSSIGTFVVPQFTSGTGSSGTGTEGLTYSGTLTVNGSDLEYEIPSDSTTGNYQILSKVLPGGLFQLQLSVAHTEGTVASTGTAPNFDTSLQWILRSPLGEVLDSAGSSPPSTTKKVFCNFW